MNRVANDGSTPLSKAAMNGNDGVARALCEAGADPNIQGGKKQWTALHYAARRSQLPSLEVLLEFGADPTLAGSRGETAFKLVKDRFDEVMAEHNRLEPVMKLLETLEPGEKEDGKKKKGGRGDDDDL